MHDSCFLQLWNKSGLGADVQRLSAAHPDYTLYVSFLFQFFFN